MKSTRRHELQHNVLNAELSKFVAFLKKRGSWIAWGILIVALIVMVTVFVRGRGQRRSADVHARYEQLRAMEISQPTKLEEILAGYRELAETAADADQERIAAGSWVRAGNIRSRQLRSGSLPDEADRRKFAAEARKYYQRAISDFPDERQTAAMAHLGLAKLDESLTPPDLEAAGKHYEAISAQINLSGEPVWEEAQAGLRRIESDIEPVRMATTAPAPRTQPTTDESTAPTSQPATDESAAPTSQPEPTTSPASMPATAPAGP